jgi:trimeric autotransporter adhesin
MRIHIALFIVAGFLQGTASGAGWSDRFPPRGPLDQVQAMHGSGGTLYVGGAFEGFGPFPDPGLMGWNGSAWNPVGTGLSGSIHGIAVDARGHVFVSGNLEKAPSDGWFYSVAYWDGKTWAFPEAVRRHGSSGLIAAAGDSVYVVLRRDEQDSIYRIETSPGLRLVPLESAPNGSITSMTGFGNDLVVGGYFSSIGAAAAHHVARLSAGGWSAMGSGLTILPACLAVIHDSLRAGGSLQSDRSTIDIWDGQQWIPRRNQIVGGESVAFLAATQDGILAAGRNFIARQAEPRWEDVGEQLISSYFTGLASRGGEVWVGGTFFHPRACFLAKWNGATWSDALPDGASLAPRGVIARFCRRGGRLLGAGYFATDSMDSIAVLAEWTGEGWEPRAPALPMGRINITSQLFKTVLAVESYGNSVFLSAEYGPTTRAALGSSLARWEGGAWIPVTGLNGAVAALRATPEGLYAGGSFDSIGGIAARHIARWDGQAWHAVGEGIGRPVSALAWDGSAIVAAGNDPFAPPLKTGYVLRWDKGGWSALPGDTSATAFNGPVHSLEMMDGAIWAAGEFAVIAGKNAWRVAAWNGSEWKQVGRPLEGGAGLHAVYTLGVSPGGQAYAGGWFHEPVSGATTVAHWNGKDWEAMGKGLTGGGGVAYSFGFAGESLFVAGDFHMADGKPAPDLALWTGQPDEPVRLQPHRPVRAARRTPGAEAFQPATSPLGRRLPDRTQARGIPVIRGKTLVLPGQGEEKNR